MAYPSANITGALVASGVLSAWAGFVLRLQFQVGQSTLEQEYLLPAFTWGRRRLSPAESQCTGTDYRGLGSCRDGCPVLTSLERRILSRCCSWGYSPRLDSVEKRPDGQGDRC